MAEVGVFPTQLSLSAVCFFATPNDLVGPAGSKMAIV